MPFTPGNAQITDSLEVMVLERSWHHMLEPDFNPAPTAVRIYRCGYISRCKAPRCQDRATLVAEKVDNAGRHVRQIELCDRHSRVVVVRERDHGLEIQDRRDWR